MQCKRFTGRGKLFCIQGLYLIIIVTIVIIILTFPFTICSFYYYYYYYYYYYDMLVEMKVSPQARKKNPNLPEKWQVRADTYQVGGKQKTVFTSLSREDYDAKSVAELYHERWGIET